jgi:hypothetical protein
MLKGKGNIVQSASINWDAMINAPQKREAAPMVSVRTPQPLIDARFSYDCLWRTQSRSKKGRTDCGVYLPDLEQPRPPDMPPGMVKLRLVKG